jgi:hypothetical protein
MGVFAGAGRAPADRVPSPHDAVLSGCMKLIAVATVLATTSCGVSYYARNQFIDEHNGCAPDVMTERPDLELRLNRRTVFEMVGCSSHELYSCSGPQYTRHGRMIAPPCETEIQFCEGANCDKNYIGVAMARFVSQATCPIDRITADFTSKMLPSPPKDIASDPARTKIWKDEQQASLDAASQRGEILVTTKGCGSVGIFACANLTPAAPRCQPLSVTKEPEGP